jgi:photosynthetic reaction center H subunit
MRVDGEFKVAEQDIDPRGCPVFDLAGEKVGTVSDIWVDRSDFVIRYLEVALDGAATEEGGPAPTVLVPWLMVSIKSDRDWLMEFIRMEKRKPNAEMHVDAVTAEQFRKAPRIASPDQVTMNEEELITAYFGGGYLYATPDRQEPAI